MKIRRFLHYSGLTIPFLLLLISGTPTAIFGQDQADSLSVMLEPLTVEATHSSVTLDRASISVTAHRRDLTDLAARRASTLDEITFTLPGIWISNRENHALGERMTVRGMGWRSQFGVRGIQVVLDDIPLTVADGQTIMNMVDPAMVTSMELLRGPSATFWGNSSGGVLYMRTRMQPDAPALMLRSYAGSFGTMKHEVRWQQQFREVRFGSWGSYYQTDGFRDHSRARLIRSGISAGFDLGDRSTADLRLIYSGMPEAQHPGSLNKEDAKSNPANAWPPFVDSQAGKTFHQLMLSGAFYSNFDSGLMTTSLHGIYRDLENPLLPAVGYIEVDRFAGGGRITYDFDNLPFDLQTGTDFRWQRDDRSQRENINGSPGGDYSIRQLDNVSSYALFAKAVFDIGDFSINAGLRGDRMVFRSDSIDVATDRVMEADDERRVFTALSPSIGISYHLSNARIYANFSTSFESPTTTEFKNRPGGGTGFNPNLDPERTVGGEMGVRGLLESYNLEYDLTLYMIGVNDLIVPFEEVDGGPTLFRNEGSTFHRGAEAHLRLLPLQRVHLEFAYSWTDARFQDGQFEGNKIPGVAPHRLGATVSLHLGHHTLGTDFELVSTYYTDSANSSVNNSYQLVNARWSYNGLRFDGWNLNPFVSFYNLMDTRYNTSVAINAFGGRYYEPGSSRSFQAGISLQLN